MSLRSQPGLEPRDLILVQPVRFVPGDDPDIDRPSLQPVGPRREAYSEQVGAGEAYIQGKSNYTLSYTIYVDWMRGTDLGFTVQDYLWHPEASTYHQDGTPDWSTALNIDSIQTFPRDGIARIEAGRTLGQ